MKKLLLFGGSFLFGLFGAGWAGVMLRPSYSEMSALEVTTRFWYLFAMMFILVAALGFVLIKPPKKENNHV